MMPMSKWARARGSKMLPFFSIHFGNPFLNRVAYLRLRLRLPASARREVARARRYSRIVLVRRHRQLLLWTGRTLLASQYIPLSFPWLDSQILSSHVIRKRRQRERHHRHRRQQQHNRRPKEETNNNKWEEAKSTSVGPGTGLVHAAGV